MSGDFDIWDDGIAEPTLDAREPLLLDMEPPTNWRVLYDLLDVAHRYGEGAMVDKYRWWDCLHRGSDSDASSPTGDRRWVRWVEDVRRSPWPIMWAFRPPENPSGPSHTGKLRNLVIPRGFSREAHRILDARGKAAEMNAALSISRTHPLKQTFAAVVDAGVHLEVRCRSCGAPVGIMCSTNTQVTVHRDRVELALELREMSA